MPKYEVREIRPGRFQIYNLVDGQFLGGGGYGHKGAAEAKCVLWNEGELKWVAVLEALARLNEMYYRAPSQIDVTLSELMEAYDTWLD